MAHENGFDFEDFERCDDDPEQLVLRLRRRIRDGRIELRGDLVDALMEWAGRLSRENRSADAVQRFDEAIALCETLLDEGRIELQSSLGKAKLHRALELAVADPSGGIPLELSKTIGFLEHCVAEGAGACRHELACALVFLGDLLCTKLRSCSAALFHLEKAIGIWEQLVREGERDHRCSLVVARRARGDVLREIGAKDETLRSYRDALELLRTLHDEDAETMRLEFLRCLVHYAKALAHFRDFSRAHQVYEQAIGCFRELPDDLRSTICDWLPMLYIEQARVYRDTWKFPAALAAFELALQEFEAIRDEKGNADASEPAPLRTESPRACPERNMPPDFPTVSSDEDAPAADRVVWEDYIDRQIAQIHTNRGCLLHDLDRFHESQDAFDAAMFHYLRVRDRGRSDVRVDVCLVRLNNAKILLDVRRHAEAIEIQRHAIGELEGFIAEGQTALRANLAQALREIGISLHFARQEKNALDMFDRSVALWHEIIDEGALEKREQLAHSLLIRGDFLLERSRYEESLRGYLESLRIRKELFEEGDWLVALPLVRTLFSAAKASHCLGEYRQSLDWSVQSLRILEQIRNEGFVDVDDYILEGARRCMGILLDMHNPDAVLEQLEKTFRFIGHLRAEGKHSTLIEVEIPHLYMYRSHALGMKKDFLQEIHFILKAVRAWKTLLAGRDRENDPKAGAKEIDYLTELGQSYSFLARAYDRTGDHENELRTYLSLDEVYGTLGDLGGAPPEEESLANRIRIAITLAQLRRPEEAWEEFRRIRRRIGPVDPQLGFPCVEESGDATFPRLPKTVLWFYPQFAQFLSEQRDFQGAIETLNVSVALIRHLLEAQPDSQKGAIFRNDELHDLLAYRLHHLAEFCAESGDIEKSYRIREDLVTRLRDRIRRGAGHHKPFLVKVLAAALDSLRRLAREEECEPLLDATYRFLRERCEHDEDSRTALGGVLKLRGDFLNKNAGEAACETYRKALECFSACARSEEGGPFRIPSYRETKIALAGALLRLGRPGEAYEIVSETLDFLRTCSGENAAPESDGECRAERDVEAELREWTDLRESCRAAISRLREEKEGKSGEGA